MGLRTSFLRALFALLTVTSAARAGTAFDLSGPAIDLKVTRADKALPISQVPSLLPGDRIWIHPDLPSDQSAHYLLVVAFLRGSTNPPPDDWFIRVETWNKKNRAEGVYVTVPEGTEQVILFLAPETGGDFGTIRSAVRGRPGAFVRAAQDLNQASHDRLRLDTYLNSMRKLSDTDSARVHDQAVPLARSLNIQLEDECFKKLVEQQAACLTEKRNELILSDGHGQTKIGALTSGPNADLFGQLTYTPPIGSGYLSPYVGAIVDLGRILDSLHTAQYQYIPALGLPRRDQLELKLNNPPSFHNPKSVIVIALPAVTTEPPPQLRPLNTEQVYCVDSNPVVLPVTGAPLAFATDLVHDLVLHIDNKTGSAIDLPASPDPLRGGYLIDTRSLADQHETAIDQSAEGVLRGWWGFDAFIGPAFKMQRAHSGDWTIPEEQTAGLVAGRAHTFRLRSAGTACVTSVSIRDKQGKEWKTAWKLSGPDEVEVVIPPESAVSNAASLVVKQGGLRQADELPLRIYTEAGHLEHFTIIPGDETGVLRGTHLDEVASVDLNGIHFVPQVPSKPDDHVLELRLFASSSATAALPPNAKLTAHVFLADGRNLDVPATVDTPRPRVSLLNKNVQPGAESTASGIRLTNPSELPHDGRLSFSLKTELPPVFSRNEKIEVSTADDSLHVLLTIADGSLTLQDPQTILAVFDPVKSFGPSAFGPIRFRPVDERGAKGDWQSLATLVRVPFLKEVHCPDDESQPCILSGTNLFLLDSVGADPQFTNAAQVPEGFVETTLRIPHPMNGLLYIKLRDNPADTNTATLPTTADQSVESK